jgi:tetraacyldisaccharide-1-P 4'-kinase
MDDDRIYRDAELSFVDLDQLLAGGITAPDGRLRQELQGLGSVAAAIQLENHLVTPEQVARSLLVLRGEAAPSIEPPPTMLDRLVAQGLAACATHADRAAFLHWLGLVANLMTLRSRAVRG